MTAVSFSSGSREGRTTEILERSVIELPHYDDKKYMSNIPSRDIPLYHRNRKIERLF
jgi:hypothetical protein